MKPRSRSAQVYFYSRYHDAVGVLMSSCSFFFCFVFFLQSPCWKGRSVSSIPGGVYISTAVAGCVRFLDLAGRAGFNSQASDLHIYTGCTCVEMFDSRLNEYLFCRKLRLSVLLETAIKQQIQNTIGYHVIRTFPRISNFLRKNSQKRNK